LISNGRSCSYFENQTRVEATILHNPREAGMLATICYEKGPLDKPRLLAWYYGATALFVVLDVVFDVNVRVSFLEPWPIVRLAYYVVCFACLAATLWRPRWSAWIGTGESLIVLMALILSMGVRVLVPTDVIVEENAAFVTPQEIVNFVLAGFVAYYAWVSGLKQIISGKIS
jgi:hypothetical protein